MDPQPDASYTPLSVAARIRRWVQHGVLYGAVFAAPLVGWWGYYSFLAPGPAAAYARGNARPFDRDAWLGDYRHHRFWMIDDVLGRYDVRGWTREEVERLLGPSTETPDGFSIDLGEDRPGAESTPRTYALVLSTDETGRVNAVEFVCEGAC